MAAKHLLCGLLPTMLLCCIAEGSTPDKHSTMLSREAFARAEVFINKTARPLERALFAFYFTHGSRDVSSRRNMPTTLSHVLKCRINVIAAIGPDAAH